MAEGLRCHFVLDRYRHTLSQWGPRLRFLALVVAGPLFLVAQLLLLLAAALRSQQVAEHVQEEADRHGVHVSKETLSKQSTRNQHRINSSLNKCQQKASKWYRFIADNNAYGSRLYFTTNDYHKIYTISHDSVLLQVVTCVVVSHVTRVHHHTQYVNGGSFFFKFQL